MSHISIPYLEYQKLSPEIVVLRQVLSDEELDEDLHRMNSLHPVNCPTFRLLITLFDNVTYCPINSSDELKSADEVIYSGLKQKLNITTKR